MPHYYLSSLWISGLQLYQKYLLIWDFTTTGWLRNNKNNSTQLTNALMSSRCPFSIKAHVLVTTSYKEVVWVTFCESQCTILLVIASCNPAEPFSLRAWPEAKTILRMAFPFAWARVSLICISVDIYLSTINEMIQKNKNKIFYVKKTSVYNVSVIPKVSFKTEFNIHDI